MGGKKAVRGRGVGWHRGRCIGNWILCDEERREQAVLRAVGRCMKGSVVAS